MEFKIGQVFIRIDLNSEAREFGINIVTPLGVSNVVSIHLNASEKTQISFIGNVAIYKRGDKDAEESALS